MYPSLYGDNTPALRTKPLGAYQRFPAFLKVPRELKWLESMIKPALCNVLGKYMRVEKPNSPQALII